jgi:tRNA A-37 threonylcarbamoyl transferase component Bud32
MIVTMQVACTFGYSYQKSELLTQVELNRWLANAEAIFEQDQYGIKVAKLANGDFIKIFRVKRLFSIAHVYSYARMFCRNAERIAKLGIPTVKVKQLYHIQNSNKTAVVYEPLYGDTILDILRSRNISIALSKDLGAFIAEVHEKGIYFRGLHLGNIVLTSEKRMGLIDIADMTIFPWSLDSRRRLKNFSRFWRDLEIKFVFGYREIQALVDGYQANCRKADIRLKDIQNRML